MWDNQAFNTHRYPYSYVDKLNMMDEIIDRGLNENEKIIINKRIAEYSVQLHQRPRGPYASKNDLILHGLTFTN
jgi:hypothetical protein